MNKIGFQGLDVWKISKELAVEIYKITGECQFSKDYSFRDQIRRAAVSIPSNIAEGDERGTNKEAVRFLYIAKGSLAEVITHLEIDFEIGYIEENIKCELVNKCYSIGKKLGSLIKARQSVTHNL